MIRCSKRDKRRAQFVAMHDHVDHAVIEQIFRALEPIRQSLADGLFDHALAGEADERAGLCDLHVAQHRIGGADAARRGVGEHDDIGQPRLAQQIDADRHARHLHQRQNAFLHARAAGRHEQDERPTLGDGRLHAEHQQLRRRPCPANRPENRKAARRP